MNEKPLVLVAHDYMTQRGGAERVALSLARAHRQAPVITALYNPSATFAEFELLDVSASWLNTFKPFRLNPQLALPLLHFAWSLRKPVNADAVIASSSGWSHAVRVRRGGLKVVYCHNPPRWLYQQEDYLRGRSRGVRGAIKLMAPMLRYWDRRAAATADVYVANSTNVANRIRDAYGIEAEVVFPPVVLSALGEQEPIPDLPTSFFLTVGRKRGYKGTDDLINAFTSLPEENLVVVGGTDLPLPVNVRVLNGISDAQLRWLYAHARGLLSLSQEDFGLSPLEANAFGTPALLLRSGGFLDSTKEGVSGLFFSGPSSEQVTASIRAFPMEWDREAIIEHSANFSEAHFLATLGAIVEQALSAPGRAKVTRRSSGSNDVRGTR